MKRPLPPTYLAIALVLEGTLHFALPGGQLIHGAWRLLGLLPLFLGVVLNVAADRALERRKTTVKPFEQSSTLVTNGVFRISRNPMYLGMTLLLAGLALLAGTTTPWIAVILFVIVIDRRFIATEEAMLQKTFGDEYRLFRSEVRRWL